MSAVATYIDCIKNGVTTVFDHHASYGGIKDSLFAIEDAAKALGVRSCLCYEVSDRDGQEKMKEGVYENEAFIKHALADDSDMIAGMFGLHVVVYPFRCYFGFSASAQPEGVGYHIHVAEGIEDFDDALRKYGKRIVNRLMDMNILWTESRPRPTAFM